MKRTMFRSLAVIFSLLLFLGNLSFLQPQTIHAAALDNAVTVMAMDENGDNVLPLTAVSMKKGDTAFDVLKEAGKKHGVEISADDSELGKYITAIGDVKNADPYYWSFIASGVGPDAGASAYEVSDGDHVFFALRDIENFMPMVTGKVSAVDMDGTAIIPETEISVVEGSTAYDALKLAAKKNNVKVNASVDDTYFTYINNVGKADLSGNKYWNVAINDKALTTGIVDHQLKKGEHVELTIQTFDDPESDEEITDEPEQEKPDKTEKPNQAEDKSKLPKITDNLVQKHVDDIHKYISMNNITLSTGSEWWLWGIANTGKKIPASYVTSVEEKIKDEEYNFNDIFELEKMIIALSIASEDATSVAGYNLLEKLEQHQFLNNENPSINGLVYGLLAVDSRHYEVPEAFRAKLIDGILSNEVAGGGWAFFGDTTSPDITGMALAALAPYKDRPEVKAAIDRAVAYLSDAQDKTGGYNIKWNGGDSSESVSQAIIGLASVGVDPTGDKFAKKGGNLLQHLLKFKRGDGGFAHVINDQDTMGMSTQQALLALAAYQKFVKGNGLVYQFPLKSDGDDNKEEPDTDVPKHETPKPEKPGDSSDNNVPKDDEKGNQDKRQQTITPEVTVDKANNEMTVSVKAADLGDIKDNQLVIIKPDKAKEQIVLDVQLPNDVLKELVEKSNDLKIDKGDTSLFIPSIILKQLLREAGDQSVDIKLVKQQAENQLGAVYDYTIQAGSKVISDFNGNEVTLTLNVDNNLIKDIEQAGIKAFYFNEKTNEWEVLKESTYDAKVGRVTANVNHFSTYGVFENEQNENIKNVIPTNDQVSDMNKKTNANGSGNGSKLPNTATSMFNFLAVGMLLIVSGIVLLVIKRKRRTNA